MRGSGTGLGTSALTAFAPGSVFTANTIVGGDCTFYPRTTMCPASWPATLPLASDGKPVGADLARIAALTRDVVVAP